MLRINKEFKRNGRHKINYKPGLEVKNRYLLWVAYHLVCALINHRTPEIYWNIDNKQQVYDKISDSDWREGHYGSKSARLHFSLSWDQKSYIKGDLDGCVDDKGQYEPVPHGFEDGVVTYQATFVLVRRVK